MTSVTYQLRRIHVCSYMCEQPAARTLDAQRHRAVRSVMFCDVVGSTRLLDRLGDIGWLQVVDRHARLVTTLASRHNGQVATFLGDGFMVLFESATTAFACALELQEHTDPSDIELRIGIDHGAVYSLGPKWWVGRTIHIASRITDFCSSGQTAMTDRCLSAACADEATPETTLKFLHVRGFREPSFVHVIERDPDAAQPAASPMANSTP